MLASILIENTEEIREDDDYYRPYEMLLKKIDEASKMQTPSQRLYPAQLESLDEVAIDVVGNIRNQLCLLDQGEDRITTDLFECISEILGDCNLEDGGILTKAIYLVSTELTSFLRACKRKKAKYFDVWYVNDRGCICIDIIKDIFKTPQPEIHSSQNKWFPTDNNIQAIQNIIMPYISSAMENLVDMDFHMREEAYCAIEIRLFLLESRGNLNPYHSATHGISLIFYLRCLQLYLHEQIISHGNPQMAKTTHWFVENMIGDETDLFLSFDPEE